MTNVQNHSVFLSYSDLQSRWSSSRSTVMREVRRWGLMPAQMRGLSPFFAESDVVAMEEKRLQARSEQIGLPVASVKVMTLAEAKAKSKRNSKRGCK